MARIALGANIRSKKPPIPPAPSQVVEMFTSDPPSPGETVVVVTMLEPVSDSVRTRPGSGSSTFIRHPYHQIPPGNPRTPKAGNAGDDRACPRHSGRPHPQVHQLRARRRPRFCPCRPVYHGRPTHSHSLRVHLLA